MKKVISLSVGIMLAVLSCGILIYAFESNRSFSQILITFAILFLPISFISSLNTKIAVFLFTSIIIFGVYICLKQHSYDTVFGVSLSILLGGATYIFRVAKAKTFDSADYSSKQELKKNGK